MGNDVFLSPRQLLHISKRKCAWMLQNGIIPCTVSGKKTHCYRVRLEDVQAFASRSAEYMIPVTFTAKPRPGGKTTSNIARRLPIMARRLLERP